MKNFPIGIQTFSDLIEENYLYVDKTREIYKLLAEKGRYYFLSRPRRFGKSLLVSTLKDLFSGNKELFKGLWIYDQIEWEQYPIVFFDFLGLKYGNRTELIETLEFLMEQNARQYDIQLKEKGFDKRFQELIVELSGMNRVVILVDEYDKPIIEHIDDPDTARENRAVIRTLYETIKRCDKYLKFVFITGVSKFSKVSIFSGLNNLNDITIDDRFATLLGYTDEELLYYFKEGLDRLSAKWGISKEKLHHTVKQWYNGYSWDGQHSLYNPDSVHYFFSKEEIGNYWFSTATPTFLIKKIREKEVAVTEFEHVEVEDAVFDSFDIENIDIISLLFQTGYLTIVKKAATIEAKSYHLSYPNKEVKESFLKHLLRSYTSREFFENFRTLKELRDAITGDNIPGFFDIVKSVFASLPYNMVVKEREGYYQTVIYLLLTLTGVVTHTEVETNQGRIDAVVETEDHVYIMEYKMGSPESAMKQIKEKKYYEKYQSSGKTIKLIGIGFDPEQRNIGDYQTETLKC